VNVNRRTINAVIGTDFPKAYCRPCPELWLKNWIFSSKGHHESESGLSGFPGPLKDADPDFPILEQAKAEYAKPQTPA
jgi:hypothetical protein